jgi:hypothetical protein
MSHILNNTSYDPKLVKRSRDQSLSCIHATPDMQMHTFLGRLCRQALSVTRWRFILWFIPRHSQYAGLHSADWYHERLNRFIQYFSSNGCGLHRDMPGGTKKIRVHYKHVTTAGAPAEIRTEHFPNANLQFYLYNNLPHPLAY